MRIEFPLQSSRWLWRYVWGLHLLMLAVIWFFSAALVWHLIATLLVVASMVINLRRCRRRQPALVITDEQWRLRDEKGEHDVTLRPPCYVSRWLLVIPLRLATGKCSRLLVPFDSLDAAQYRRLKVQLQLSL